MGCISGRTLARHGQPDLVGQHETDLIIYGARYIMEAMEDWVGGLQLQHFLYGSRGRTCVSVYRENRIPKMVIEDCKLAMPRKGG